MAEFKQYESLLNEAFAAYKNDPSSSNRGAIEREYVRCDWWKHVLETQHNHHVHLRDDELLYSLDIKRKPETPSGDSPGAFSV